VRPSAANHEELAADSLGAVGEDHEVDLDLNRHLTRTNPRAPGRITLLGATNGGRILSVALDLTSD
jgi:hypothetical protein